MVEGPGATRNVRKVQLAVGKFFVGTLRETGSGSVSEDAITTDLAHAPTTIPRHLAGELHNHVLSEAFTVGKELFLVFASSPDSMKGIGDDDGVALRLHFGMFC